MLTTNFRKILRIGKNRWDSEEQTYYHFVPKRNTEESVWIILLKKKKKDNVIQSYHFRANRWEKKWKQ